MHKFKESSIYIKAESLIQFEILNLFWIPMQKLSLSQTLQQKLSPQQIQFIKLLQVPTAELENRIEEELELNPTLEEGEEDEREPEQETEVTEEEAPEAEAEGDPN